MGRYTLQLECNTPRSECQGQARKRAPKSDSVQDITLRARKDRPCEHPDRALRGHMPGLLVHVTAALCSPRAAGLV